MTEPTDAEIADVARKAGLLPDNSHPAPETRATRRQTDAVQAFARAVLAKLGTPQAGAVPLTDEQREAIWQECRYDNGEGWEVDCWEVIDAVERHHRIGIKGGQHGADTRSN